MDIIFVSGNDKKFNEFTQQITSNKFNFIRKKIDLTEIQNIDGKNVITHKINEAKKYFPNKNIIIEDTSLSIHSINGFPGAYIKDFYSTIGPHKITELFNNNTCTISSIVGLLYNEQLFIFEGNQKGIITNQYLELIPDKQLYDFDCIIKPSEQKKVFCLDMSNKVFRKNAFHELNNFFSNL
jgi:non-canonical purine NTP pyrophosphatase (RdgB/HAM1 family)